MPLLRDTLGGEETVISSTFVRACVAAGDVAVAAQALGRPHRLEGVVVRGDQRGRELGYPTANLELHRTPPSPRTASTPAQLRRADGVPLPAAISIGTNPTFEGRERRVEAYVLDATDLDLYGEHVSAGRSSPGCARPCASTASRPWSRRWPRDVERTRAVLARPSPVG